MTKVSLAGTIRLTEQVENPPVEIVQSREFAGMWFLDRHDSRTLRLVLGLYDTNYPNQIRVGYFQHGGQSDTYTTEEYETVWGYPVEVKLSLSKPTKVKYSKCQQHSIFRHGNGDIFLKVYADGEYWALCLQGNKSNCGYHMDIDPDDIVEWYSNAAFESTSSYVLPK